MTDEGHGQLTLLCQCLQTNILASQLFTSCKVGWFLARCHSHEMPQQGSSESLLAVCLPVHLYQRSFWLQALDTLSDVYKACPSYLWL